MDMQIVLRRAGRLLVAVVAALAAAATAFALELHEGVLGALYQTVATLSLAGLDTAPRGAAALVTTMLLSVAGVAIFGYVAAVAVEVIARGVLTGVIVERWRRRAIEALHDIPHVVLDSSEYAIATAEAEHELLIRGKGTEDEDLAAAGLARARRLVADDDADADNLYISLSARAARPDLLIAARGFDEEAMQRLKLAGADQVVLPFAIAERVMASVVAKPQVAAFLDIECGGADPDFRFEQIEIPPRWWSDGSTISALRVHDETGAAIIAVQKRHGELETKPSKDLVLEPGDVLVGLGTAAEIHAVEELFDVKEPVGR